MMLANDTWSTLRLAHDAPHLLVKTRFDDKGYDIQLTDLGRIWGEILTKDAIIRRAREEGCSIDPSEGDQYSIFLDKIRNAFAGGRGTTVRLEPADNGSEISINISAQLPGSLPTFQWHHQLTQLPNAALSSHLVTPLLSRAYHLQHTIQQLIDEITAKDRVIAKITDRLEASGNDLTTVFPGVSNVKTNRKRSQREQLASHVKGLADFDEYAWLASSVEPSLAQDPSHAVMDLVLKDLPAIGLSASEPRVAGDWWRTHGTLHVDSGNHDDTSEDVKPLRDISLDTGLQTAESSNKCMPSTNRRDQAGTPSTVDEEPDPISKQDRSQAAIRLVEGDATTDDENDLDAAPSRTSSQTKGRSQLEEEPAEQASSQSPARQRSDVLSGASVSSLLPQPPAVSLPGRRALGKGKLGAFGGKAKVEISNSKPESRLQEEEPRNVPPPKPKPKLGTFGGKAKTAQDQVAAAAPAPRSSRLGKFGGKKNTENASAELSADSETSPHKSGAVSSVGSTMPNPVASAEKDECRQARPLDRTNEVVQEREKSEERADKKRERLKRELEDKAKAPVKRKRKF